MKNTSSTPEKQDYWVLSASGGKDSTALGLEWLRRHEQDPAGYPLDEVIYCDIGMEFPAMVEHIDRLEQIFTEAGIRFTRIKNPNSFEYYMFDYRKQRDNPNVPQIGHGWPTFRIRWCTSYLKTDLVSKYMNQLRLKYNVFQLIGLAADEGERIERRNNQEDGHIHPLMDWGWTEADCLKYCYDRGFDWGGLYEMFHRVSCWCCPLKSLEELRVLRKNFPDLWARLAEMDRRAWNSFKPRYSVDDLEVRFAFEEERIALGLSIKSREFFRLLSERLEREKREKGGDE